MIGASHLRTRLGSGVYQTGRERVTQILATALEIFVERGYAGLTLREVARRCGVRVGAVTYYYESPNDLLLDMINMVLTPYAESFRRIREDPELTAEERMGQLVRLLLEDMGTKQTTRVFSELWALANHDPLVAKAVDSIYILERLTLTNLIAEINPSLSGREREAVAVYVAASIAGSTLFIGFEKPWAAELPLYSAVACRALLDLVRNVRPAELPPPGAPAAGNAEWTPPTLLTGEEFRSLVGAAAQQDGRETGASATAPATDVREAT